MEPLVPHLHPGSLTLVIAPRSDQRELLFPCIAQLAQRGGVTVIDGGNLFDAYRVARLIRQRTPELDAALGRIHVARSFTCYQTRALLGAAAAQCQPLLALDLLATFGDETVPAPDVQRALQDSIFSLQRLSAHAAVLVSAAPAHGANGESLLNCLLDAIPQVIRLSGLDVSAPPPWF